MSTKSHLVAWPESLGNVAVIAVLIIGQCLQQHQYLCSWLECNCNWCLSGRSLSLSPANNRVTSCLLSICRQLTAVNQSEKAAPAFQQHQFIWQCSSIHLSSDFMSCRCIEALLCAILTSFFRVFWPNTILHYNPQCGARQNATLFLWTKRVRCDKESREGKRFRLSSEVRGKAHPLAKLLLLPSSAHRSTALCRSLISKPKVLFWNFIWMCVLSSQFSWTRALSLASGYRSVHPLKNDLSLSLSEVSCVIATCHLPTFPRWVTFQWKHNIRSTLTLPAFPAGSWWTDVLARMRHSSLRNCCFFLCMLLYY